MYHYPKKGRPYTHPNAYRNGEDRGSTADLSRSQLRLLRRLDASGGQLTIEEITHSRHTDVDPRITDTVPPRIRPLSLIGRGLVVVEIPEDGPAVYRITPEGRRVLRDR